MIAEGIIRKISVGDLKNGITYKVGQRMAGDRIEIVSIILDVETSTQVGSMKYNVFVRPVSSEHSRMWKSFVGMPVAVEYDIDEEKF